MDISQLEIYNLPEIDEQFLTFNITQASEYWGVAHNVIAKRKRSIN